MGVYVKKMKMPDGCASCDVSCGISDRDKLLFGFDGTRPDNCTLVEISEPHGRLIDADDVKSRMIPLSSFSVQDWISEVELSNCRTVIEAEE